MWNRGNKKIIIVGAGGIGSNLFQKLTRYAPGDWDILLIDGDNVEYSNIMRQMFTVTDVGKNKAEVLTRKANNTLAERNYAYPHYLSTEGTKGADTISSLIVDSYNGEYIIFGCLDNHPARLQIEKFIKSSMRQIYYIDCANGENDGDVVACYKERGQELTGAFRSRYDASVFIDTSNDPNATSCSEQLDAGNIQTLIANDKAGIIALELFHHYLRGEIKTGLWRFSGCVEQT